MYLSPPPIQSVGFLAHHPLSFVGALFCMYRITSVIFVLSRNPECKLPESSGPVCVLETKSTFASYFLFVLLSTVFSIPKTVTGS